MRKYSSPANVISLEQSSIKLAGQASNLVSAFKMACLAYNPSPVHYRGKSYDRISLLRARNKLLQEYWRRVQNMPLLQIAVSTFDTRNQILSVFLRKRSLLVNICPFPTQLLDKVFLEAKAG